MPKAKKDYGADALRLHKKKAGKFSISSKVKIDTMQDLSIAYTPGVGAVSSYLAKNKKDAGIYTMKGNSIAVVSDGSAVLGLGNIGPEGALPVMEGKAIIFKHFANIDAVPIVLNTQDTEEIIQVVKAIAPTFGGINLEDISAPRSFEIEERLKKELDIPVMHDDQHGTAIVILAGLVNALKVVKKNFENIKVVVSGAGAAGHAFVSLAKLAGIKNIIAVDRQGAIYKGRPDMAEDKNQIAKITNPKKEKGSLKEVIVGADVFIGVSSSGLLNAEDISKMNTGAIVFALANPSPEIMPDQALKGGAIVVATGRSDFPNQLNNALVFPGIFRGALDNKVKKITDTMKINAAYALAKLVKKPEPDFIIPNIFDNRVVKAVAKSIK